MSSFFKNWAQNTVAIFAGATALGYLAIAGHEVAANLPRTAGYLGLVALIASIVMILTTGNSHVVAKRILLLVSAIVGYFSVGILAPASFHQLSFYAAAFSSIMFALALSISESSIGQLSPTSDKVLDVIFLITLAATCAIVFS